MTGEPSTLPRRAGRRTPRRRPARRLGLRRIVGVTALVVVVVGGVELASGDPSSPSATPPLPPLSPEPNPRPRREVRAQPPAHRPLPFPAPRPAAAASAGEGITTFRGNRSRSYYGEGPVPRRPEVLWRYPASGGLCARSRDETGRHTWCGVGWTGQPNVIPRDGAAPELRFGAYDRGYHFLNGRTGEPVRSDLETGDLAKGSATSDPDGYPLYYAGSRDNRFRIVAMDRPEPEVLWSMDAPTTVPDPTWNNDWDGAALVVGDYLIEGGENSWLYIVKLNRGWTRGGKVRVRPEIVVTIPSWDSRLSRDAPDRHYSIENSVEFRDGVVYFANSAGLVQGWDISAVLRGGSRVHRVFRFWTGDDTDASIVIDEEGMLYVASELEKMNARSLRVGQLMKLDPARPRRPLVWSLPLRETSDGKGGVWSTPALDRKLVYVATNAGGLVAVERDSGKLRWEIPLPGPTWSSPVVVDNVLIQGDCGGELHAYDVSDQRRAPPELWSVALGGCIEATPAVWRGRIYIGTRAGAMMALGDAAR